MKKHIYAGIDIGGTNTVAGLVDENGIIIDKIIFSTKGHKTFEKYIDILSDNINMLLNRNPDYELKGIGAGAPSGNALTGKIEYAANLEWKGVLPLAKKIKERFKVRVKLTNDANVAAIGEKFFGKAKDTDNFIMITLGTGLGSGIFTEGKLLYGATGAAGELGHVTVIENGRLCGCGKRGCLETYVSATGIMNTVKEFLKDEKKETVIREYKLNSLTSKDIYEFAESGDKMSLEIFDFTAEILGKALAGFVTVLSPEKIIFSGGLANAHKLFLKSAEKYMNDNLIRVYKNTVKLEISGLKDGEAAVSGAAALVFDHLP